MSVTEPTAAITAPGIDGRSLRVEFLKHNDRYTHRILCCDANDQEVLLLEAVEDPLHDPWPCSPVLQGLNLEDLHRNSADDRSRQAAMLIGMAGDGHWSLVVKPEDGESGGMIFEPACRVKSLPPKLSSCYRVASGVELSREAQAVTLASAAGEFRIQPLALSGQAEASCSLSHRGDQLHLTLESSWELATPTTLQWRYALTLV